jgi:uncharacterized membrane protein YraQ (UPF0718 family)/copper chaperone CopZ
MLNVAVEILGGFWAVLGEMAPYLLFGFLVAGLLSVVVSPQWVERHLGGRGVWPVVKAAAFGVPLPLCSCGVIPVGASLRRHGASRGATVAFLIATPQDGADSILVTFSLLGPVFAVFRPVAALVSGVLGGVLAAAGGSPGERAAGRTDSRAAQQAFCEAGGRGGRLRRALAYGFGALPQDIGRALLVGLFVAALISALVPRDYFADVLGGGIVAMLVMMAVGIPVYVCATASVPVAAALIAKGVSPGAALVFLMTGPATNAATVATLWKVLGRRTALVYLATVAATALAAGLTLDYVFRVQGVTPGPAMAWMLPAPIKWASAVVLLAVLAAGILRGRLAALAGRKQHAPPGEAGRTWEPKMASILRVTGMTCNHCRETVRRALLDCPAVESVQVDLAAGVARVAGRADPAELRQAVTALGYGVEGVDQET